MINVPLGISLSFIALLCEYVDSTLGMGYGTALAPALLLLGFTPMQVVPVVLISELFSGLSASFFHHKNGNVNFKPATTNLTVIIHELKSIGYIKSFKKTIPHHLKVALLLGICSIVGTILAVFIAINVPKFWLKLYIGFLVLLMGVIILVCLNRQFKFSWLKIVFLGAIASFNKGMSGGGYGPVVTGGQILSGVDGKSAVGVTSLAEGLTCLVGVVAYVMLAKSPIDWKLAPWIIGGAIVSVPLAAVSVKKIKTRKLKLAIAVLTIILGSVTIIKTLI